MKTDREASVDIGAWVAALVQEVPVREVTEMVGTGARLASPSHTVSNDAEKSSPYLHGSELIASRMIHGSFSPLAPSKAFIPRNFERSTVLRFLLLMSTALGGASFLHEHLALRELLAGYARD